MRKPDYTQILKVLNKQAPDRPALYEFFLNEPLEKVLAGGGDFEPNERGFVNRQILAYKNAGYDYVTIQGSHFHFPRNHKNNKSTISLNEASTIYDRESYENYKWPEPEDFPLIMHLFF